MPIIAVMTGEGQKKQPAEVNREENGETEIMTGVQVDKSKAVPVEGSIHVNHGGSKEQTITTFEVGFGC